MAANSLLSYNSCCLGQRLRPPARGSILSRRYLLHRPISLIKPPIRLHPALLLSADMQQSNEETKPISSAESPLDSTKNASLNIQLSSLANLPTWAKLVLGSAVLLAIPIFRKSLKIKDVTKLVEKAADVVETVAEVTEKVVEEIAEVLPDGSLKEEALKLEKVAAFIDKSAEVTESFIDKVEDAAEVWDTNLMPLLGEMKKNIVEDQSKEAL